MPGGGAVPDGLVAGLGERPALGATPGGRVLVLHALLVVPLLLQVVSRLRKISEFKNLIEL